MIRVRVDWQSQCPGCGTQLAVDFLENLPDSTICPWCGHVCAIGHQPDYDQIRSTLRKAARELEDQANAKAPV